MIDSDDYTSEDQKRKRDMENPEAIFKRSKKVNRTPQKEKQDKDDKIDRLTGMMEEVMKDIKEIKQDQKQYYQELNKLKQENEMLKEENKKIKEKMNQIEGRLRSLEKEKVKNNIIISGLEIKEKDKTGLKHDIEYFIERTIGVNVQIKEAREIGTKMCKVELDNTADKEMVMKNKNKLKHLQNRIYINNELTKEEKECQKTIKQIAEEERKNGKTVKIGYQKLTIDGTEWKWNRDQEKLLENKIKTNNTKN